jgi:predicted amidohydrolase YtcJ
MMLREELIQDVINLGGSAVPFNEDEASEYLQRGPIKLTQDGSIQGLSGALTVGYCCDVDNLGVETYDVRELTRRVTRLHDLGLQIALHANGDKAIDSCLEALESAIANNPRQDHRHRIEHCQTVRPDQLQRMARLGIAASFFIKHVYYWGDEHRDIFLGNERAASISPLRSASESGVRWGLHSDCPITPADPLLGVWCAATRRTLSGSELGPREAVTVDKALRGYLIDAAWLGFQEGSVGSLEVGKLADFVVLDQSPLDVPVDVVPSIRVLRTYVGGRQVYGGADSGSSGDL